MTDQGQLTPLVIQHRDAAGNITRIEVIPDAYVAIWDDTRPEPVRGITRRRKRAQRPPEEPQGPSEPPWWHDDEPPWWHDEPV
jgi:hypothetical protein